MKSILTLISFLFILCNPCKSQERVISLNERNFEHVYFPDSWDSLQSQYYKRIALIVNDYAKKFYSKRELVIFIRFHGTRYIADVDDRYGNYITNLIQNKKNPPHGILLTMPDTILPLNKVIKIVDIGFSNFDELNDCKKDAINSKDFAKRYSCRLSEEYIESMLNTHLTKKQYRFIKRIERKY